MRPQSSTDAPRGQSETPLSLGLIEVCFKRKLKCAVKISAIDSLHNRSKEGPVKQTWWKEEIKFEIERLKSVLRDPEATDEEKAIAQSQIANYQEMSVMAARPAAEWLQQVYRWRHNRPEFKQNAHVNSRVSSE